MKEREDSRDQERVEERTGQGRGGRLRSVQSFGAGHGFKSLWDIVKVEMIGHTG